MCAQRVRARQHGLVIVQGSFTPYSDRLEHDPLHCNVNATPLVWWWQLFSSCSPSRASLRLGVQLSFWTTAKKRQ